MVLADAIPTRRCAFLIPRYPEKKAWSKKLHCYLFNGGRQFIFKKTSEKQATERQK
jgi:hypothetical protein